MESNFNAQLELDFSQRRRCHIHSAADRVLRNYKKLQRLQYFRDVKCFKQDHFIAYNGIQIY